LDFGSTSQRLQRFLPTERRKLAAEHKEAGQKRPGSFAFLMQSLRSRISPKQLGLGCKARLRIGDLPSAKGILYRKASARFSTVEGGLVPIACGADSVASALQHDVESRPVKSGTSHFALTVPSLFLTIFTLHDNFPSGISVISI
jgi:hypothetical protein